MACSRTSSGPAERIASGLPLVVALLKASDAMDPALDPLRVAPAPSELPTEELSLAPWWKLAERMSFLKLEGGDGGAACGAATVSQLNRRPRLLARVAFGFAFASAIGAPSTDGPSLALSASSERCWRRAESRSFRCSIRGGDAFMSEKPLSAVGGLSTRVAVQPKLTVAAARRPPSGTLASAESSEIWNRSPVPPPPPCSGPTLTLPLRRLNEGVLLLICTYVRGRISMKTKTQSPANTARVAA